MRSSSFRTFLPGVLLLTPLTLVHCGSKGDVTGEFDAGDNNGTTGGSTGSSTGFDPGTLGPGFGGCDAGVDCTKAPEKAVCADGFLSEGEGCDDSNLNPGDGCSATCQLEPGWACPTIGLRCEAAACGDGIIAGTEECERTAGSPVVAGCSSTCRIQAGYDCNPTTFACATTACGNKSVERGEACDDTAVGAKDMPFDGCYQCKTEPKCTGGVCVPSCGDGQRFAVEDCDDGNTRNGDGCSSDCKVEPGFGCTDVTGTPPEFIALPVVIRDFISKGNEKNGAVYHEDFNDHLGSGILGIVGADLGADGRPVYVCPDPDAGGDPKKGCLQNPGYVYTDSNGRHNTSTKFNFDQWYRNVDAVNKPLARSIVLKRQGNGSYLFASDNAALNNGITWFDPIHDDAGTWVALGKESMPSTCNVTIGGNPVGRNVSFTTETHFWFEYQGNESFAFAGDDDTWVYVNGKLVIDLGGLHGKLNGSFSLSAATGVATAVTDLKASTQVPLGMTLGGVYEVVMFQAERNQCGSNFTITLKDFNRPKSACKSTCGDGKVAIDELCDDGKNDGSYGGCMAGCKARGPRCGDGTLQAEAGEQCDDGNLDPSDACTNACLKPTVK